MKKELLALKNTTLDKKVKLVGTDYDRRRTLTNKDIYNIKRMYKKGKGKSIYYIANKYGVSYNTIKYHLSEEYKKQQNKRRKDYVRSSYPTPEIIAERVEYKRNLIANNKRLNVN